MLTINKMQEIIKEQIKKVLKKLEIKNEVDFMVEHPENFENGDYSTNVAMVFAKQLKTNPRDLAEKIVALLEIQRTSPQPSPFKGEGAIQKIEVAGAGFINFYLSREFFSNSITEILKQKENWGRNDILSKDKVMVEYTQPNPFKPLHIGHLMSNSIGESISRIFEFSGAEVIRANYQGDVGLHVAKAIYVLLNDPAGLERLFTKNGTISELAQFIGDCYVKGNHIYENNEEAKKEINIINKKIYEKSDEKINNIYQFGRKITLVAFEEIYKILGTKFNKYYFESEMAEVGKKIVLKNLGPVFEESDGAIVFHGEEHDPKLHTRVFINSEGLPTYEAKELGLNFKKFERGLFKKQITLSILTTAIEQSEYMKVVINALSLIRPELEDKIVHITHGMMRMTSGKMSSRKGNVITGESLLRDCMQVVLEKVEERELSPIEKKRISEIVGVGVLKYSILKSAIGGDIIFDFEKSISFEGDSGPYLQYTAVRAYSILEKAKNYSSPLAPLHSNGEGEEVYKIERTLYQFPEIIERSYKEFAPHYIVTYLIELASAFNSFYGNNKILESENKFMQYQLSLVKAFYQTMKNGLWLLGIEVPERM